jgi:uncharacterized membrane protein YuzA (DUF378 family)
MINLDKELINKIAFILLLVGGLNLGLEGLIGVNLLGAILGKLLSRLLFLVIGVGAGFIIYEKYLAKKS